ncbi:hypothetical protein N7481_002368 [Penicillium waksmanii]|uniref:uncharacterized protein n=1 Tax=Penicillium waksmanii TaxID=69791 RepID=UPI002548D96E|nr:uncharacterized protein N7481_002368 [Penicillium waksmanii]KAJ5995391.1 hypothetical protein N7481_002368 [Penicillium waksmanii]
MVSNDLEAGESSHSLLAKVLINTVDIINITSLVVVAVGRIIIRKAIPFAQRQAIAAKETTALSHRDPRNSQERH